MKALSIILFLSLFLSTISCGQGQKQLDEAGIEGVWEVTEGNGESPFTGIWKISSGGFFCELKYITDGGTELECDWSGTWELKKEILTFNFERKDGVKAPNPVVVKFNVAKVGEEYLLKIVEDKIGYGHNLKSQILRLRRW